MLDKYLTALEKIYYKSFVKFNKIDGCFYANKSINKAKRVVLYFDYPKFIHLGDILWCEPIARLMAANFNLAVCCNKEMEFYFQQLGYKIIEKSKIKENDLLVARTELAFHLKNKDVFWINFNYRKISKPLINAVLKNLSDYLGISPNNPQPCTLKFSPEQKSALALKFNIVPENKYAVFNNYVDSLKFGTPRSKIQKADKDLRNFVDKYKKNTKVKIIHTGTETQKKSDKNHYEVTDLDLRGMTTVEESFILASLNNVIHYIGFDSLWLHLFNMYDKNSFVEIRPGFSENVKTQIKNFVAVPYKVSNNKVTFIE